MRLLHLDSSIQGENSASRAIGTAIVERLRSVHPDLDVTYRDLAAEPLSHLTSETHGTPEARGILHEFKAADVVVIGAPLYNFTLPSQLKAWIDRIIVVGETFGYTESGPFGLAGGKRVIVALARGGVYAAGTPFESFEHGETLLRNQLAFIGVTEPEFIIAEGLALGDETRQSSIGAALDRAGDLAVA